MTSHKEAILKRNLWWVRDTNSLALPLGETGTFDSHYCMNPFVLRIDDEYHLYYAGGDEHDDRRLCLATASVDDLSHWKRHGPILELGEAGSFDAKWAVLPHVVQIAPNRWHMYYTGNCGVGEGLSQFPGIGLAISDDGKNWQKYEECPILAPTGNNGDPDAMGIAGGAVINVNLPNGDTEWRFYYTGCPTIGNDLFLDQQKRCCLAISQDGIHWERQGAVMWRNPDHDYENVAAAGPVVSQLDDGTYRMWYSAIGTRWGAYSIAYAESDDGLTWRRGTHYGDNLQIGPIGTGWERQMVAYPSVIQEGNHLRLFYCGNDYGGSGIGTALSSALRATPADRSCQLNIVASEADLNWTYQLPVALRCDEGIVIYEEQAKWHGPDARGMIWHESQSNNRQSALHGLDYRVLVSPTLDGLDIRFTVFNQSDQVFHNLNFVYAILTSDDDVVSPQVINNAIVWSVEHYTVSISSDRGCSLANDAQETPLHYEINSTLGDLQVGETLTVQSQVRLVFDGEHK